MILASHGVIASQIASFDADALAFFARVTAAGGTLSLTEKIATNQLVLDLKANSLWTPMKAIYPMVGASAAACAQNLKSSSFTGTFTATGWTFASTGVLSDGSSAYMNTSLNCNTILNNERHFSVYNRLTTTTGTVAIGAIADPFYDYIGLANFNNWQLGAFASRTITVGSNKGLFLLKSLGTLATFQYNGVNKNDYTVVSFGKPNSNYFIGCAPINANFQKLECAFASIGDGLTDTEASNFYTAVQAFNTTLSRQV